MAKQQLWIINSGLVIVIALGLAAVFLLKQELPQYRMRRRAPLLAEKKQSRLIVTPEKIYQNDLFDTFILPNEPQPTAKNLVTPIPQLKIQPQKNQSRDQKVEFISPLSITIKGIIMSEDPYSSIVMAADQTGKEQMYHIGDKILDGQVVKITKNQMIVIRSNGQQETFLLRKIDKLSQGLSSWDHAIKKIDDTLYHLDPVEIVKEITSVGEVIEALDICGAYKNNAPIGLLIGSTKHHPLAERIGLQTGDIITHVNNLPVSDSKERIAAYDAVAALPMGGYIHLTLERNGQKKEQSYLLKKIERPSPFGGPNKAGAADDAEKPAGDDLFKLSQNAQRQEARRLFEQKYRTKEQHEQATAHIRKKMLDDMRTRAPNRRVL